MGKRRGDTKRATGSGQKERRLRRDRGGFPENIEMLSTRGRRLHYSRPKAALLAAEGSANCGRESMTFSYEGGENGARRPWESDKIAKFVEEKVMA